MFMKFINLERKGIFKFRILDQYLLVQVLYKHHMCRVQTAHWSSPYILIIQTLVC